MGLKTQAWKYIYVKGWQCLIFVVTIQCVAGVPRPSIPDPLPAQALGGVQPGARVPGAEAVRPPAVPRQPLGGEGGARPPRPRGLPLPRHTQLQRRRHHGEQQGGCQYIYLRILNLEIDTLPTFTLLVPMAFILNSKI